MSKSAVQQGSARKKGSPLGRGIRFIFSLPVRLIRLLVSLPRRLIRALKRTRQEISRLRRYYRMARHWIAVNLPRERWRRWRALYFHPRRLEHRWRSLQTGLRGPGAWESSPALGAVYKAVRWGRAYRRHASRFQAIEALRSRLYADTTPLDHLPGKPTLGELARRDAFLPRWGALLHGLAFHARAQRVLEINTGFGLGTLYLARGLVDAYPVRTCMLVALDENTPYLKAARKHITQLAYTDFVTFREGRPADTLAAALELVQPPDLIFIARPPGSFDGQISLREFARIKARARAGTLIVLEDIHTSPGMTHAWESIRAASRTAAAVDLWRWGIVVVGDGPVSHLYARL